MLRVIVGLFLLVCILRSGATQNLTEEQIKWQNKMMAEMVVLSPGSGSVCGQIPDLVPDRFACGVRNLSAATTRMFLDAKWRLEKIIIYLPSGAVPGSQALTDLRNANPGTPVEVRDCAQWVFDACENKAHWVVALVPPQLN